MPALELHQRFSVVCLRVVQDRDHGAAQVPQEIAEKEANLLVSDVVELKLVEQAQALALRADRNSRDDRDLVPAVAVAMHGSLAARSPGLDYVGDQQESGFVGKDDVGAQPRGFFFTLGQSCRFHCSIASSFRSMARFSGF